MLHINIVKILTGLNWTCEAAQGRQKTTTKLKEEKKKLYEQFKTKYSVIFSDSIIKNKKEVY